ncbi:MAG: hypothetical protein ACK8QZ_03220, partial [Anaerolineales bacterium]
IENLDSRNAFNSGIHGYLGKARIFFRGESISSIIESIKQKAILPPSLHSTQRVDNEKLRALSFSGMNFY